MKYRTISIGENAYDLLKSLKNDSRDTFSKVVLRHVHKSGALKIFLNSLEDFSHIQFVSGNKFVKPSSRRFKRK